MIDDVDDVGGDDDGDLDILVQTDFVPRVLTLTPSNDATAKANYQNMIVRC